MGLFEVTVAGKPHETNSCSKVSKHFSICRTRRTYFFTYGMYVHNNIRFAWDIPKSGWRYQDVKACIKPNPDFALLDFIVPVLGNLTL